MAINFPNSPSVNDIHVSGANRWQWNGSSWTRIGGVNSDSDTINSTNDNSTTTLYPVMVSGTGDQTAKIATTANKNLKFNAAEGDLTVGGDISGINANLTGILTASQYNSITAPGANITGVATALQLKGPLTSSGINVTGVSTFSGNVTVGGILTYEDVKNVDSIGLGTFRNGVVVKTGTATTALIVEGDARITGILTVGTGSLVITDKDINATGIITGSNFKSGTTNVHSAGVELAGVNVLGADTPIGTGATVYNSGLFVGKQGAEFQGVVTASSFKGSGADLTDVISGIGIGTESGIVGYAATIVHFKGPGVSTAYYSSATGVGTVYFQGGGGSASVSISETAPSSPSAGDMWWDSDVGNLQIYYTDANSSQWVTANNSGPQGPQGAQGATGAQGHQGVQGAQGHQGVQGAVGAQGAQGRQGAQGVQGSVGIASLTISTGAPSSPAQGDMWWDSDDANLSIYYNDGNSSQWVNINAGPAGAQGAQGATGAQGHQGVQGASGSNATISSNADNRVITGGSGTNLVGESNFTYDGNEVAVYAQTDDTDCILHLVGKTASGGVGQAGRTAIIAESTHNSNGQSAMHLRTRNTSNAQIIGMTIDGNQNVGIGTQLPHNNAGTNVQIHSTNTTSELRFTNSTTGGGNNGGTIQMGGNALYISNSENGNTVFENNGSERVRITSGGRVNIGGNYTQTTAPLAVTTNANAFGYRLLSGSNSVCDILNNDSAGNCEIRGYYNNNSGTRGEGFRIEANGETWFKPGGTSGLNIKSSGQVEIGGATSSADDIDATHTKLTIKQSANNQEDGIYIERSGERRGWYQYVGGALSSSDALCFTTNQLGGDTHVLAMDRGGDVKIGAGNLVFTTSGNGIDFSATSNASGGSNINELFEDYEEGTWTPANQYLAITNNNTATYTKVGRLVTVQFDCTYASSPADTAQVGGRIEGLPFTSQGNGFHFTPTWLDGSVGDNQSYNFLSFVNGNDVKIIFYSIGNNCEAIRAQTAGKRVRGTVTYMST